MKKHLCTVSLLPIFLVALASTKANAQDLVVGEDDGPDAGITRITLKWDRNPEPDIAGYSVYYGRISGEYRRLKTVAGTTAVIGVRGSATYYFAVTAFNTNGAESELSEEVHWP